MRTHFIATLIAVASAARLGYTLGDGFDPIPLELLQRTVAASAPE